MTASRIVLIGIRSTVGLAITWLAALLLIDQAPSQSLVVASLPTVWGAHAARAAAGILFLAGICLVFRILDRLLVVLLAAWSIVLLASAWKLPVSMYQHGNPLLVTATGWELVVTMVAIVSSGGLAWATRATRKPDADTYLSHPNDAESVSPTRSSMAESSAAIVDEPHIAATGDSPTYSSVEVLSSASGSAVPFAVPPSPIGAAPALGARHRSAPMPEPGAGQRNGATLSAGAAAEAQEPAPQGAGPPFSETPNDHRTFAALLAPSNADSASPPAQTDAATFVRATTANTSAPNDPPSSIPTHHMHDPAPTGRRRLAYDNQWVHL